MIESDQLSLIEKETKRWGQIYWHKVNAEKTKRRQNKIDEEAKLDEIRMKENKEQCEKTKKDGDKKTNGKEESNTNRKKRGIR